MTNMHGKRETPQEIELDLGELEPLWAEAIKKALEGSGIEITVHANPTAQNGAEPTHEPTSISLGTNNPTNTAKPAL